MAAGKLKGLTFGYIPDELLFSSASSNAKIMYAVLTRYLNNEGQAWPTQETLTNRLAWSESTVRRAITELLRLGWLTKEQCRVNHGTWAANIYTLNTKAKRQQTNLRRHRRSNLTAGTDQGKQAKPAGHNGRSNLTDRTRENEFRASEASRPSAGAPLPRPKRLMQEHIAGCSSPSPWAGKRHDADTYCWDYRQLLSVDLDDSAVLAALEQFCERHDQSTMDRIIWELRRASWETQ